MTLKERLQREDWPRISFAVKWLAGGQCQLCPRRYPYPYLGMHAHHNNYKRLWRERPEDLIALCGTCHTHVTYRKRYADLVEVRGAEVLGIIEAASKSLEEIGEQFYQGRIREIRIKLDEFRDEIEMMLAAEDAWREWRGAA